MNCVRGLAAAGLMIAGLLLPAAPVAAETPRDTLVMAWQIDDIITLDPAEIFEFSASEIAGNTYERLIGYDLADVSKIFGVVAESWTVSEDGRTLSFKIRENKRFASGNPLTAEDVVFSLQRAVKLDKSPAFIIGQFGLTPANAEEKIRQTGDFTFELEMDKPYAPTFVLYCLTATVASVVDKDLVLANEVDGDLGYGWLKTNYAGSGPFMIRDWRASEVVVIEKNTAYTGPTGTLARVVYRHIGETATQRLLLEKGDIDIARNLGAEELDALASNPDILVQSAPKGTVYYLGLNQKNEHLAKPKVREALKYLVDYDTIAATVMKSLGTAHQAFLPKGMLGAVTDRPFRLDVAKAKALLADAGLPDGFKVTMDTRSQPVITGMAEAIQQTFAAGGVDLEIIPGDGKQTLTKYRARQHDIYIGQWGPDYQDPHTNAQTFASNPDNSDEGTTKTLAWRNAWDPGALNAETDAAILESDPAKRAAMYQDLQRKVMADGPFVIVLQQVEVAAVRKPVAGFVLGPSFDSNSVVMVTK
ncbi:ABC transporter substrate-binding protein [Methylobrevis albus]|nr:ABC transporter substrate-binding protein [Methylobrevis albus]